eukprot:4815563-Pyramimonas_sp.AAC.1
MGGPWVRWSGMRNRLQFLYFEEGQQEEMERCWSIYSDMEASAAAKRQADGEHQAQPVEKRVKKEDQSDAEAEAHGMDLAPPVGPNPETDAGDEGGRAGADGEDSTGKSTGKGKKDAKGKSKGKGNKGQKGKAATDDDPEERRKKDERKRLQLAETEAKKVVSTYNATMCGLTTLESASQTMADWAWFKESPQFQEQL